MFGCSSAGQDLALGAEAAHPLGVEQAAHHLDGDLLVELVVVALGEIDGAHAAFAEHRDDAVRPEPLDQRRAARARSTSSTARLDHADEVVAPASLAASAASIAADQRRQVGVGGGAVDVGARASSAAAARGPPRTAAVPRPSVRESSGGRRDRGRVTRPCGAAGRELVAQPRLGHAQLAVDRRRRDADRLGGLVVAQAAEEVQLDDRRPCAGRTPPAARARRAGRGRRPTAPARQRRRPPARP